jgi:Protein of unknown function (DUF3126)
MTPQDIARVEAYLRRTLGSDRIHIVAPTNRGGSVEVRAGQEFLGTLQRDTDPLFRRVGLSLDEET